MNTGILPPYANSAEFWGLPNWHSVLKLLRKDNRLALSFFLQVLHGSLIFTVNPFCLVVTIEKKRFRRGLRNSQEFLSFLILISAGTFEKD